jgi:hypothetical protein
MSVGSLFDCRGGGVALAEIACGRRPLFMFVTIYFDNRFVFDLFVWRASLLLTIAVLTATFALLLPVLGSVPGWAAPWVWAVVVLPVVTVVPWVYGRMADMLDRRWLGRRFSPVEAVKQFLSALRSATSEAQLIERGEQGLSEIFGAPALVRMGAAKPEPSFAVLQEIPIRAGDGSIGVFLLGPRASEAPTWPGPALPARSPISCVGPRQPQAAAKLEQDQSRRN